MGVASFHEGAGKAFSAALCEITVGSHLFNFSYQNLQSFGPLIE